MQAAKFDRAWILPYAHRAGVAESLNEWVAAEVSRYPWLAPGASFHPDDEVFPALVEHALVDLRLRVVNLHCSVGAFPPSDRRLVPLWEIAATEGVPILIHVGQNSPGNTAASELEALGPVLRSYPRLNLVLAHTGHPSKPAALGLMAQHDNLYADITPVWLRENEAAPADLERFAGCFLFGSAAPNSPVSVADQVARFEATGLSDHAFDMLMGGTAERLIPGDG